MLKPSQHDEFMAMRRRRFKRGNLFKNTFVMRENKINESSLFALKSIGVPNLQTKRSLLQESQLGYFSLISQNLCFMLIS